MLAYFDGMILGFSLIIAIGAQNAFILKQGVRQEYVFILCLICALSDAILILLGVTSFALIEHTMSHIAYLARIAGAIFLLYYGLKSFWDAIKSHATLITTQHITPSRTNAILTCLAFTWLNPHVYLDTVILLGSISSQYPNKEYYFAAGAVCASFIFFFSLGYAARMLAPIFKKPMTWRILDTLIGCMMWFISFKLLIVAFH